MGCYRIVAFRESGPVSQCPIRFDNLEAAKFCAEISILHFGEGWTVLVEEQEDGAEQIVRPADYDTPGDPAANSPASGHPE
jgi:hypothetical protein